jgi:signal transduction histidine kinase
MFSIYLESMAFLKASPERNWLICGFTLVTLLMGFSSLISYQNANQLIESSNKSQQTYEVIKKLQDVHAAMTIAESGRRGYIYLDDWNELQRYQEAVLEIPDYFADLKQLLSQNSAQSARLRELEGLVNRRLDILAESIRLYKKETPQLIMQSIFTNRSIAIREEIQRVVKELQYNEEKSLKETIRTSENSIRDRKLIEFWLLLSSAAVIIVGAIAIHSELIKRQEAETSHQKLTQQKEMSELKLRFFSMMSHEFRTPLSTILGSAQLLAESDQTWTEERKLKNVRRIQTAAKSMTQLLTHLLMLTRADAGKLECNPEAVDLEAFCLNLMEDFEASYGKTHSLEFMSDCSDPHAYLDERLLYSTLSNLLTNAFKYSPPQTLVRLILRGTTEQLVFQIQDQGMGISIADQQKLYEPFYRGQNVSNVSGTGLGLAVVKRCVDLQQGEVMVDSREGKGTTVTVRLPRCLQCKTAVEQPVLRQNVRV